VTRYKLVSLILVSPPKPKVIATINGVITSAFSGILFNFVNTITVTALVENGGSWQTWIMVDASHVTRGPHKISSGAAILLLPFSSFGSSFIDYQLYRLARPSCRTYALIN